MLSQRVQLLQWDLYWAEIDQMGVTEQQRDRGPKGHTGTRSYRLTVASQLNPEGSGANRGTRKSETWEDRWVVVEALLTNQRKRAGKTGSGNPRAGCPGLRSGSGHYPLRTVINRGGEDGGAAGEGTPGA